MGKGGASGGWSPGAEGQSLPLTPFTLFLDSKPPFGEGKGVSHLLCPQAQLCLTPGEGRCVKSGGLEACAVPSCRPSPWGAARGTVEGPGKGQMGWAGLVSVATGLGGSGGLGGSVRAWESETEEPPGEATACARPGVEEELQGAQLRSSLGRQSGWAGGGRMPGAQPQLGWFSRAPVPGVWVLFLP